MWWTDIEKQSKLACLADVGTKSMVYREVSWNGKRIEEAGGQSGG